MLLPFLFFAFVSWHLQCLLLGATLWTRLTSAGQCGETGRWRRTKLVRRNFQWDDAYFRTGKRRWGCSTGICWFTQIFFTADFWDWTSLQDDKLYLIFLPIIVIKVHIKFIYIILAFVIFVFVDSKNRKRVEITRVCGGGDPYWHPCLQFPCFSTMKIYFIIQFVYMKRQIYTSDLTFSSIFELRFCHAHVSTYTHSTHMYHAPTDHLVYMHLRYQRDTYVKLKIHELSRSHPVVW